MISLASRRVFVSDRDIIIIKHINVRTKRVYDKIIPLSSLHMIQRNMHIFCFKFPDMYIVLSIRVSKLEIWLMVMP